MDDISKYRKVTYPIHPLILNRWSKRAMSGKNISDHELMSIFEAARWAPSSYNNQPWKFLYAKKDTPHWDKFFNLLVEFNQSWAKNAAALVVILSRKNFEHNNKLSRTHNFDAGAAWQNMALQGTSIDLVVHGMEGFSYKKAREELNISEDYDIQAMVAIGRKGLKDTLPLTLQEKELPNNRKNLDIIINEGPF